MPVFTTCIQWIFPLIATQLGYSITVQCCSHTTMSHCVKISANGPTAIMNYDRATTEFLLRTTYGCRFTTHHMRMHQMITNIFLLVHQLLHSEGKISFINSHFHVTTKRSVVILAIEFDEVKDRILYTKNSNNFKCDASLMPTIHISSYTTYVL